MLPLRSPSARDAASGSPANAGSRACSGGGVGGRLNLLLSYGGWQPESWIDTLPRLLEPMGVRAWRARSGREAADFIRTTPVHIAVVDLSLPLETPAPSHAESDGDLVPAGEEGGERIIEILQRLECPPPTVIVKRRLTSRENARALSKALMAGVFAVLEPPVNTELALEVMRRILGRHYGGCWPAT